MNQHYLFLSSDCSLNYFPHNNAQEFTVALPQTIRLQGHWKCSLKQCSLDIAFPPHVTSVFVCVDFCEESFVGDKTLAVLREIPVYKKDWIFTDSFYFAITRSDLSCIKISIRDQHLSEFKALGTVSFILHLKQV